MEVIKSQVDAYLHGTLSCEIIQQLRNSYMGLWAGRFFKLSYKRKRSRGKGCFCPI